MISIKHKFAARALLALAIFLLVPMSTVIAQEENPIGGDRGVDIIAGPGNICAVRCKSHHIGVVAVSRGLRTGGRLRFGRCLQLKIQTQDFRFLEFGTKYQSFYSAKASP